MRYPEDVPVLTDQVITLRALTLADAEAIVEQCNDPAVIEWTTVPVPYGLADAVEWVAQTVPAGWAEDKDLVLAIDYEERFAGSIALRPEGEGAASIGYGLSPWARGKGVMSSAVRLILAWGFTDLSLTTVRWQAGVGNWPSRHVAEATGFTIGPIAPDAFTQRGTPRDAWNGWITAPTQSPQRPDEQNPLPPT